MAKAPWRHFGAVLRAWKPARCTKAAPLHHEAAAARELGLSDSTSYTRRTIELFDGIKFTADDPIDYLKHFAIKHDIYMAEIDLSGKS